MFDLLYPYLIRNKQLSLPGIGQFATETLPAHPDIASKLIQPPVYRFRFTTGGEPGSKKFYAWLAAQYQCSEWDAIRKLNEFIFEIKKVLQSGSAVLWKGVGMLQQNVGGAIEFQSEEKHFVFAQQVVAEKVLRHDAAHAVLVGDKETTSSEMAQILTHPTHPAKTYSLLPKWWAIAIVLGFLAIMFIGWHFSENGFGIDAAGNTEKISPEPAPAGYRYIR